MKILSYLPFIALLSLQAAMAGSLSWKSPRLEIAPEKDSEQAIGYFEFTNTGKEPVIIKSATSSCGECTDLVFQSEPVAPGAKAELIATVNTKGINGRSVKIITVETNEAGAKPDRLELVVLVPEKLSVAVKNPRWEAGDMAAKEFQISSVFPGAAPYVKEVNPQGLFNVTISKNTAGDGHSLVITPQGEIKRSSRAMVKVAVKDEKGTEYVSTFTALRR